MAFTPYTGKSAAVVTKWKTVATPKWKQIQIQVTGKPQAGTKDTTDADSTAYENVTDPLGGKGTAKTVVTISGNMSKIDFTDSGWSSYTSGDVGDLTIQKGAGAGKDLGTLTNAKFLGLEVKHPHAAIVGFTARWELNGLIAWTTSAS